MKSKKLSAEMERALAIIKASGSIVWYSGGFWAKEGSEMVTSYGTPVFTHPIDYVGVQTLEAIERRELIIVAEEKIKYGRAVAVKYILKP